MRKIAFFLSALLFAPILFAQDYNPNRYQECIFDDVLTISDVNYGEAPQWIWPYWNIDLNLDVYVPDGDDNPKRPLIIFAHAGGFINGSKEVDNMVAICDSFARKGYVTASIDYRKGFDPLDTESAERAVYRAVQDGKAAVRYFKQNASLYDIDTSNIFFAGMSAGGFISLHVAYMDKESERPESTYGGGTVNDLECLDCAGNDYPHSSSVRAIIDFWGAVDDTTLIEEGDIPALIMHGENDETVPFIHGHPFGLFTLPETYGGQPISERMESVGVTYEMFTSTGPLHMLDGSDNGTFTDPPNSFWSDTLLPESERFLYEILKPNTARVSDDSVAICAPLGWLTFEVSEGEDSHFIWSYDEASINLVTGAFSNEITLEFMVEGDYTVSVVEFNDILCPGDTITFNVKVEMANADFGYDFIEPNYVAFDNLSPEGATYTWYFGDGTTSDEYAPNHVYEAIGEYTVTLHQETEIGCVDTSQTTISIDALGIQTITDDLNIYPNPFQNNLTLEAAGIRQIWVADAQGRLVYQSAEDGMTELKIIDTENWSTGLYFLTIQLEGGSLVTQKMTKK